MASPLSDSVADLLGDKLAILGHCWVPTLALLEQFGAANNRLEHSVLVALVRHVFARARLLVRRQHILAESDELALCSLGLPSLDFFAPADVFLDGDRVVALGLDLNGRVPGARCLRQRNLAGLSSAL